MTPELQRLIAEASVLAGGKHQCDVLGHVWITNGGRQCPYASDLAEPGCSQAYYVCSSCGLEDYGDPGGPGHRDCVVDGPCTPACADARDLLQEYEETLQRCARGDHPEQHVSFQWSYEGNPDVPKGTRDFKAYHCSFCHREWTA